VSASHRNACFAGIAAALAALALVSAPATAAVLSHEYLFETPGAVIDTAGSANGTLIGDANTAGGTLNLDGNGDYAQIGAYLLAFSASDFSVTLDARQTAPQNGFRELISQGASSGNGFYIGHNPGGNVRLGDSLQFLPLAFPQDQAWHSYALTVSAANGTQFYIDGMLAFTQAGAITVFPGGNQTRLGAQFGGFGEYFLGNLDNVRIWDGALSAGEVASLPLTEMAEPTTLVLLGLALSGLGVAARRRR
jgi:hypothetical protein